ncbi:MAG: Ppx/GppA phosphatase family protein [Chloroflexota bacterium]
MQNQERVAIIDLGSNTARMVVMSGIPGYAYRLDDEIREVVRLRQGMTADGLSEEAQMRALFTLRLFKRYCDSSHVDLIIPTATSAVREGVNGALFVQRIHQEIGLSLRVLSGDEEAYYGVLGVLNEVPMTDGYVLDIGGGSAQVSQVCGHRFEQGTSLLLGALALTEQFIHKDPPGDREIKAVVQEIHKQLATVKWLPSRRKSNNGTKLVGLGGTIRNMAAMAAARQAYPLNTLHGFVLDRAELDENIQLLSELPLEDRQDLPGLNSDRADIILPGALVLREVMECLNMESVTISVNGLREGLYFEHFWQHLSFPALSNMRQFSVLNKARIYQYSKAHANHVRFLAGRLFNQLAPLHGYGWPERELLDAAALLHDLGTLISYNDHHHHSQTLITNSGLPSFTPRETALIALLTRYHRKGKPRTNGFDSLLQPEDDRLLLQLTAMLRLAEFLSWVGTHRSMTSAPDGR